MTATMAIAPVIFGIDNIRPPFLYSSGSRKLRTVPSARIVPGGVVCENTLFDRVGIGAFAEKSDLILCSLRYGKN
jgi:hypothetical protein